MKIIIREIVRKEVEIDDKFKRIIDDDFLDYDDEKTHDADNDLWNDFLDFINEYHENWYEIYDKDTDKLIC